ncbi:MAG: CPBP family intramembrane glutamic endopeptidase [Gemmatimonadota bacterium]
MRPRPTRRQLYGSLIVQLVFFLVFGWLTAWRERIALWRAPDGWLVPGLGTLFILAVLFVATIPIRRKAVERREPRVYFAMPVQPDEMALWVAVSVMAGVSEEYVYRWVFSDLGARLTGSLAFGWALSILAFSVAHATQGSWAAVLFSAAFALLAHLLVFLTGTLVFAIALHAVYDVLAGIEYRRLGLRLGYPEHGLPDADAESAVTTSPAASSP